MPSFSIDQTLTVIALVFALVGGVFAWIQWQRANRLKRADFIHQITEKLRTDTEISQVIYLIEYSKPWYNMEFHGGGELERQVDTTLAFFSYICYLRKARLLSRSDFRVLDDELARIANNPSVQAYLFNLYHFARRNCCTIPHQFLLDAIKHQLPEAFFDECSSCYPHYLNFQRENNGQVSLGSSSIHRAKPRAGFLPDATGGGNSSCNPHPHAAASGNACICPPPCGILVRDYAPLSTVRLCRA